MASLFADPTALALLAAQLQAMIAALPPATTVRAWVAGCATGEDAYACAMLLHEAAAQVGAAVPIKVFATDADPQQLAAARAGIYPLGQIGLLAPARRQRFWFATGNSYHAKEIIRAGVVFAAHRLLLDPPFVHLNLIICRQPFAALEPLAQLRVCDHFAFALRPGGVLLLGAELPAGNRHFSAVDAERFLYLRRSAASILSIETLIEPVGKPAPPLRRTHWSSQPSPHPGVVVGGQSQIIHLYPGSERFLRMRRGPPSYDLLEVVHPLLREPLRVTLMRAAARGRAAESPPVRVELDTGVQIVTIVAQPLLAEKQGDARTLVLFDAVPATTNSVDAAQGQKEGLHPADQALLQNEHLLVLAQYDAAIQALRIANEDLRLTNEELMIANEELDVRREELDTLNGELLRINNELNSTVEEISLINADLQNLIAAIDIGTLFLDRELCVRRYTPQVEELFNLIPADHGRQLMHLTHQLRYDQLLGDIKQLLEQLSPVEREVQHADGRWFLVRLRPYRTADHRIDGVVLTFLDISERRQVAEALRDSEQRLRLSYEELERRVQERTSALVEAQERLQRLVGAVVRAQEDERGRVARELHDTLGQFLTALTLRLSLIQQTPALAPAVREGLADLHRVAAQIDSELDRLTVELRPPALDDLGLEDALHEYTREWSGASGVPVDVLAHGLDGERLPPAVETTVYRIVQEALTNVLKHAQASQVSVILERRDGWLRVIVEDNGRGFDPDMLAGQGRGGRQLGLIGMSERAALAGGELSIESAPGSGTAIFVHIPLMQL
ncbi:MAG TPA: PAS domain-containing protein [Roseiflexaceae bacterium]|nr:PAS domain-containing protein [Roseiflexaceae bacterium]